MASSAAWVARASGVILAILVMGGHAAAQGRTDVVTLPNGDRITGEVVRLDRGRLEFKTDDVGTLYLEWDKVATVQATRAVEVVTEDGGRILGSLGPAASRTLTVVGEAESVSVDMAEVTIIRQIGSSFWSKLDGSIDAGYSYTRSSGVAQLNVNWDTYYRTPAARARLAVSLTQTRKDDDSETDDRGSLEASYLRYPWQRWFISAAGRFETNKSLGLELRSQVGAAIGPRLVNSNRGQLGLGAGLVFNDEQGVDVERTQNVEALVALQGVVLHLRSAEDEPRPQRGVLPEPERPGPAAAAARRGRQARALEGLLPRAHPVHHLRQPSAQSVRGHERRRRRGVDRVDLLTATPVAGRTGIGAGRRRPGLVRRPTPRCYYPADRGSSAPSRGDMMRVRTTLVFLVVVAGATTLAQVEAPRPVPRRRGRRRPARHRQLPPHHGRRSRATATGSPTSSSRSTTACGSSSTRITRRRSSP